MKKKLGWCQRRLRVGKPEGHVHGTVQRDGSGQLDAGLLWPSQLGIQDAKTEVAVGLEWTHTEIVGQGEGLAVVGFGLLGIRRITTCGGLAEETKACAW